MLLFYQKHPYPFGLQVRLFTIVLLEEKIIRHKTTALGGASIELSKNLTFLSG